MRLNSGSSRVLTTHVLPCTRVACTRVARRARTSRPGGRSGTSTPTWSTKPRPRSRARRSGAALRGGSKPCCRRCRSLCWATLPGDPPPHTQLGRGHTISRLRLPTTDSCLPAPNSAHRTTQGRASRGLSGGQRRRLPACSLEAGQPLSTGGWRGLRVRRLLHPAHGDVIRNPKPPTLNQFLNPKLPN